MRYLEAAYEKLHDFRYEGGAPINSGSQISVVNEKFDPPTYSLWVHA
jgi:hypothetical protein